ncbi:MAG: MarR family winged helix-turn-helix transcriptional regulator [Candidatus Cyclobacteriaceae bacterium M3_2C_046]
MKLEEEIKQTKFESEYQKLMINILYTGNWAYHNNKKFLKKYDVSPEQFNVLRILRGQYPNPSTVNLLNDRMLDKMSNVSRLVEKLRVKGLVVRKECPEDRRQVDIIITDKGLALLEQVDQEMPGFEKNFTKISPEDAKALNVLLDRLRD